MLVLTRKCREQIIITDDTGAKIVISVNKLTSTTVSIGINAPSKFSVKRFKNMPTKSLGDTPSEIEAAACRAFDRVKALQDVQAMTAFAESAT